MKTAREEQEDNINNNDTEIFSWGAKETTTEEWKMGKTMAEAQNWARTLAETPSNLMTPTIFVEKVLEKFNQLNNQNVEITVYDEQWMVEKKMGCLLGVAQGSNQAPKFLQIRYKGAKNTRPLAFVGKGVTFDSGGISIKPSAGMGEMKGDMGGAAAVVSATWGIAALGIAADIVCLVPLCENMPSGRAIKPGDVLVAMNGKTVEVDNTDAEGRLILAGKKKRCCT
jgi:aminopeptidase